MMAKFRKKVLVEAEQVVVGQPFPKGVCTCGDPHTPHVHSLEGTLAVSPGDWIMTGIKGEHWPIKPDIFAATYEPA